MNSVTITAVQIAALQINGRMEVISHFHGPTDYTHKKDISIKHLKVIRRALCKDREILPATFTWQVSRRCDSAMFNFGWLLALALKLLCLYGPLYQSTIVLSRRPINPFYATRLQILCFRHSDSNHYLQSFLNFIKICCPFAKLPLLSCSVRLSLRKLVTVFSILSRQISLTAGQSVSFPVETTLWKID